MLRALLILLSLSFSAQAEQFSSGVKQNQLVELYTSEGCSSCPPADRFLAQQSQSELLWHRRIPLAFHVDYWDGLGWPDRYADNRYTRRQSKYKTLGLTESVYTPQFVIQGEEWRAYFARKKLPKPSSRKVGVLSLSVINGKYQAEFSPHKTSDNVYVLNIAQLAMAVEQKVANGENGGRTLAHNFLVVAHQLNANQGRSWDGELASSLLAADAYAAWVSLPDTQKPLQVTGGYSQRWLNLDSE
jgi:hypothetical protein